MVGAVVVHKGRIIGEGYHEFFGGPHAEVNAINSVSDPSLLSESVLYISLEPCIHHGKTPPCADLILEKKIPRVVVGCKDPNIINTGKGIDKLKNAGVEVVLSALESRCQELNRRFFTFHLKKRPYIILKWAQSSDGFIDRKRSLAESGNQERLTGQESNIRVHRWRSQEQAIMVGTTTALLDNPELNVRYVDGKNPLRVVLDREKKIPGNYKLFSSDQKTLVFTNGENESHPNVEFVNIDFSGDVFSQVFSFLFTLTIQFLIVAGRRELINSFIKVNLWDEARVITVPQKLGSGIKAPSLDLKGVPADKSGVDHIQILRNS